MSESEKLSFGYWSDPLCIWAYVAQPKLDRVLQRHGHHVAVDYHIVPVFGDVMERFTSGAWAKAGPEGRIHTTREIAHRFGFHEVDGSAWRDACPASSWAPSVAAKGIGILCQAGDAPESALPSYLHALRTAFFVENRNIALRDEQLRVAEQIGVQASALEKLLDNGRALAALCGDHQMKDKLRIQGSPSYVFDGGRAILYGNVSEGVVMATVEEFLGGHKPGASRC